MKRILWILGAALVAVLVLCVLLVVLLPRETLKTRIGEQIAAWTGRDVSLRGEPTLDFFPGLTVTLKDVQIGGPPGMEDAAIVSMDRLTGRIRLLPLIIGRVEVGAFTMVRPRIHLVRDEEGRRNWIFDSGAAALQLAFAGDVPLGDFKLQDGTVIFENRQKGATDRLDSANLTVDWPSVRQPLGISGSGIWRGEQLSFSGDAAEPFEFLRGERTGLALRLESAPITMRFDGTAANEAVPVLSGSLQLASPSLRRFAGWLGSPIGPGSTLAEASLAGAATLRGNELSVENATLALDGNNATGALRIVAVGKPEITGTLAFPTLDLSPYFAGMGGAFGADGAWRQLDLETGWFRGLTADIRLSAGSVQAGPLEFGDTAATVALRDRRLEIGLAGAAFNSGRLSGDAVIVHAEDAPSVEAQLRATDFDLAPAAEALGLPASLSGTATLALDVATKGRDLGTLLTGLTGTGSFGLLDGALPLFGLEALAPANDALAPPQPGAPVRVSTVRSGFAFAAGSAAVQDAQLVAASLSAAAAGSIRLADGSLALQGMLQRDGASLPFEIGGTLARPVARALPAAPQPAPAAPPAPTP
jgi:AsmA protein